MKTPCEESGFHYCANCGRDLPIEQVESLRTLNASLAAEVGRLQRQLEHAEKRIHEYQRDYERRNR